jgi:DNA helicase II / ATP-dependent DNA helicase PcrA
MTIEKLVQDLNEKQREAVAAPLSNMLVLAGAGSGKTRVLVQRIAWLVEQEQLSPFAILAVTFTNKAAKEMKARIESMSGLMVNAMWVGTFHGIAHRLLRAHWQEAGLLKTFQIIDSEDQLRLIKRVMKQLDITDDRYPPKQAQGFINRQKEKGLRAQNWEAIHHDFERVMQRVYEAYEKVCVQSGLIDFADMLLKVYELFIKHPDVLRHYQQRFRYILVDEFQDTNDLQYKWLSLLKSPNNHTMVVGDDDQSIYSWRGARIENMLRFQRDFEAVNVVRLEQNYRSTGNILQAANHLISNNASRMGKDLWTSADSGDLISIYAAFNDRDEANFIIDRIRAWHQKGEQLSHAAILYRSNAQSRLLEESLIYAGLPYRIYGGMRFYERMEIKDALGYLHLIDNRNNDAAFERVINTPTRGIGARSLELVRQMARDTSQSLWEAAKMIVEQKQLPARALTAVKTFVDLIEEMTFEIADMRLPGKVARMIEMSGLKAHFAKDRTEKGRSRVENVEELVTAAEQFREALEDDDIPALTAFLTHAALEAGETQSGEHADCVQLMTLHSAKGLEFPLVFIAGMEEDLFPHQMAVQEDNLDEERRLCYVGMTRAMQKLYLCHAETRYLYGRENYQRRSRFIDEMPPAQLEAVRLRSQITMPLKQQASSNRTVSKNKTAIRQARLMEDNDTGLKIGQQIQHKKFGSGCIINITGAGPKAQVEIKFDQHGCKCLLASFVK